MIKKQQERQQTIYHEKSGIIFTWQEDVGSYEPIAHNVVMNPQNGEIEAEDIMKGDIFFEFIAYIRFSSMEIDKRNGKKTPGMFEIYQWAIAFQLIKDAMLLNSSKSMTALSRQSGKTHSARKILAFLAIFLPSHIYIPEARYYCIMCSPKHDLIEDHMSKMEPEIEKAAELFNIFYPQSPIVGPWEDKTLKNKLKDKEFDRMINGEQISYSQIIGLSLNKSVTNAGYSAHMLFLDEAQEIDNESFNTQVAPFVTRTGGISYAIGTTLPDDTNVLYNYFKDSTIPDSKKIIYDWKEIHKCKKYINEAGAEKYRVSIQAAIDNYGERSDYIQTQYYCSFKVRGDRFITMEDLENNNILAGHIEDDISGYENINTYRIAAFDPATTNDYAAFVHGICMKYPQEDRFKVALKTCKILNPGDEKVSSDTLLNMVVTLCEENRIDMIMIDATAAQEDRAFLLYKKLRMANVNTLVIPYSYAGQNKQKMMLSLEDAIYNQELILPRKEYMDVNDDYKELVDEILYLQQVITGNGTVKYAAPVGDRFFDDCVMALAQLNFLCRYVQKERKKRKVIDLGDGIRYLIRFHRNSKTTLKNNVIEGRASHYHFN